MGDDFLGVIWASLCYSVPVWNHMIPQCLCRISTHLTAGTFWRDCAYFRTTHEKVEEWKWDDTRDGKGRVSHLDRTVIDLWRGRIPQKAKVWQSAADHVWQPRITVRRETILGDKQYLSRALDHGTIHCNEILPLSFTTYQYPIRKLDQSIDKGKCHDTSVFLKSHH